MGKVQKWESDVVVAAGGGGGVGDSCSVSVGENSREVNLMTSSFVTRVSSIQGRTSGPLRRSTIGGWTPEDDAILTKAVYKYNAKNWKKIAEIFTDRSDVQCLHRWQKVLNPELVKGPWTREEDDLIVELVKNNGPKKWSHIAKSLPGRIGKQCRERWHNHLNPDIKKDAWTREEEEILIKYHKTYGNKWAEIARFIPGRADNSIKNHWNCSVKKRVETDLAAGVHEDKCGFRTTEFYLLKEVGNSRSFEKEGSCNRSVTKKKLLQQLLQADKCGFRTTEFNHPKEDTESQISDRDGSCKKIFPQQPILTESSRLSSRDEIRDSVEVISVIQSNDQSTSEYYEGGANRSAYTDGSSHCSVPSPLLSVALSLGGEFSRLSNSPKLSPVASLDGRIPNISLNLSLSCEKTCEPKDTFVPLTRRLFESPKRPCHYPSSPHGYISTDPKFSTEFDNPFFSFSPCEFGNGKVQVVNTPVEPKYNVSFSDQSQSNISDVFETGRLFVESAKSPVCCFTPPSMRSNVAKDCLTSPEAILRKVAKSFKNTPSIIRKRPRQASKVCTFEDDSDEICTPENRYGYSGGRYHESDSQQRAQIPEDCLNSTSRDVKWLSLSSRSCTEFDTPSTKSVEKRLELEFDMEWENSQSKGSTSVTASDSSNSFNVVPSDGSPDTVLAPSNELSDSLRVESKELFGSFLLHRFGDACLSETKT